MRLTASGLNHDVGENLIVDWPLFMADTLGPTTRPIHLAEDQNGVATIEWAVQMRLNGDYYWRLSFDREDLLRLSQGNFEAQQPLVAWCDDESLRVRLTDGRQISTPLWWYPSLLNATHAERNTLELSPSGIHWPGLDEDLSIEGMLRGWKAPNARPPAVAAE